jgi:hypothetical protein
MYNILAGKPEGKRSLKRLKLDGNTGIGLREMRLEGVNWIYLYQDRDQWWALVNMVMNI